MTLRHKIILIVVLWLPFLWPQTVPAAESLEAPPLYYERKVVIEVRDSQGNPVEGVKVSLKPVQGRLIDSGEIKSDQGGLAQFSLEPEVVNPLVGRKVKDRFLYYHAAFEYQLSRPGFIGRAGQVKDRQEFSQYLDPLYHVLNHQPSTEPLTIRITLESYREYLPGDPQVFSALQADQPGFMKLVDSLNFVGETHDFVITPSSIMSFNNPEVTLSLGLVFIPMFDPAETSVGDVGNILFRKPVASILPLLKEFIDADPALRREIRNMRINIYVSFMSRLESGARPMEKLFSFHFKTVDFSELLNHGSDSFQSMKPLEVTVDGRKVSLTGNLKDWGQDKNNQT